MACAVTGHDSSADLMSSSSRIGTAVVAAWTPITLTISSTSMISSSCVRGSVTNRVADVQPQARNSYGTDENSVYASNSSGSISSSPSQNDCQ